MCKADSKCKQIKYANKVDEMCEQSRFNVRTDEMCEQIRLNVHTLDQIPFHSIPFHFLGKIHAFFSASHPQRGWQKRKSEIAISPKIPEIQQEEEILAPVELSLYAAKHVYHLYLCPNFDVSSNS